MKIGLNGQWQFSAIDAKSPQLRKWKSAEVPGCNFADLMRNGDIDDPFKGENEKAAEWVGKTDFIYRKIFSISKSQTDAYDAVYLTAERLDTVCTLKMNGKKIGYADNFHIKHCFDVKDALVDGENVLEIVFVSPVNYVKEKYNKYGAPINSNGQNGIVHIRKPQCHYGWDWGPVLPPSGVSGDIYIDCRRTATVERVDVEQVHKDGKVTLNVDGIVRILNPDNAVYWAMELVAPDGSRQTETGVFSDCKIINGEVISNCPKTENNYKIINKVFEIGKPELWQTRELSGKVRQPIYKIKLTMYEKGYVSTQKTCHKCIENDEKNAEKQVKNAVFEGFLEGNFTGFDAKNNQNNQNNEDNFRTVLSEKEIKIGLRTIELNREKDKFGNNFQFVLNGIPIFCKGAAWIPADSIYTRFTGVELDKLLDAAEFSNFNMIRVWGGGFYESDEFYDKCDERGILVWQDFCFACQAYPFFENEFLDSVKHEVEYNVNRLKHHASLALWCGNNEIEVMSNLWAAKRNYVKWTEKFFYHILPETVKKYDKTTPYIEGSPCGNGFMKHFGADNYGDTHLWAVWHGLQPLNYYRNRFTRFCSEFGFESLPDLKTVKSFATEADFDLSSPVMRAHQKCNSGNKKMAFYIASRYRLPKKFVDYIYLSELCQENCVSDAAEHWRRNKGRCNGALYWQFNDCWPVSSWAGVDYFGRYKALQYTARHFFAPQSVSIEDNKNGINVYALNDLNAPLNARAELRIIGFDGKEHYKQSVDVSIESNGTKRILSLNRKFIVSKCNVKTSFVAVNLYIGNELVNRKTCLFTLEKNTDLPKSEVEKRVEIKDGVAYITLKSAAYQRRVMVLHEVEDANFSDNWFDLLPNEEITVKQKLNGEYTAEEYLKGLKTFSVADVIPRGTRFGDFITRARIFLEPMNFFQWIGYQFM